MLGMLIEVQRLVVATIAQTLLYGIYLETLIQCLRWLIFIDGGWTPRDKINSRIMAFATGFIFLTSTTNLIFSLQYTLEILREDEDWHMNDIVMSMVCPPRLDEVDGTPDPTILIYKHLLYKYNVSSISPFYKRLSLYIKHLQ
ncbi:hypothetical protein JOM56_005334 [Amanita muscaria]